MRCCISRDIDFMCSCISALRSSGDFAAIIFSCTPAHIAGLILVHIAMIHLTRTSLGVVHFAVIHRAMIHRGRSTFGAAVGRPQSDRIALAPVQRRRWNTLGKSGAYCAHLLRNAPGRSGLRRPSTAQRNPS